MSIRTNPESPDAPVTVFLKERELADRWGTSLRTLQRWRAEGTGPDYLKIGGFIRYELRDIEAFEDRGRRENSELGLER